LDTGGATAGDSAADPPDAADATDTAAAVRELETNSERVKAARELRFFEKECC
jgi:hypothetical protein